jgi:hypothetical protein
MALPERERAAGWVGQAVIDRDGTEIGSCTAVYADDATGLTEWISVGFEGRSVMVPVVDAAERDGRVQVAVARADVAAAPSVDDGQHVFGDEEMALYRHYGIEYSRAVSDTVLPAGEAPSQAAGSGPSTTASSAASSEASPPASSGRLLVVAAAALTAVLAVVAAVVRRRRIASRRPPARRRSVAAAEAARRARTASVHVRQQAGQLAAVTTPLLATAGQVSLIGVRTGAVAARQAAHGATLLTKAAASRAAEQAGVVAQAGVQVGRRVGVAVESVPELIVEGRHRVQDVGRGGTGVLSAGAGVAAGYVLGVRAGRQRFDHDEHRASTVARRPEVQQIP